MHDSTSNHRWKVSQNNVLAFLVIVVCAGSVVLPATAHAPSDMSISYNGLSEALNVTITHQVPNPQAHYVQEIHVTLNGNTVQDMHYTSQPSPDIFTYTYPLLPVPGDTIEVTASCSIAGSISRTMYVPGPTATSPGQPETPSPTQKAAPEIIPVLGALFILWGLWRR